MTLASPFTQNPSPERPVMNPIAAATVSAIASQLPLEAGVPAVVRRHHPGPSGAAAVLRLAPQAGAEDAHAAEGRAIGRAFAHAGLTPPADHLHPGNPVRAGWTSAQRWGRRAQADSRPAVAWTLDLRLQCWLRGVAFDAWQVTPALLTRIAPSHCPVTGLALNPVAASGPAAATAMVLDPARGAVPGQVVVVSSLVAQFRGFGPASQVLAECLAQADAQEAQASQAAKDLEALASGSGDWSPASGLSSEHLRRLADLIRLVTPEPHARSAESPLRVVAPARVHLTNPAHGLQAWIHQGLIGRADAQRLLDTHALMPHSRARRAWALLLSALLARRMSARPGSDRGQIRSVMADAWAHPIVRRRWQELLAVLDLGDCDTLLRRLTARHPLAGNCRWVPEDQGGALAA